MICCKLTLGDGVDRFYGRNGMRASGGHKGTHGCPSIQGIFFHSARSTTYHYFTKSWLSHVLADEAPLYTKEVKAIAGASLPGPVGGRKGDQGRLGCLPSVPK